MIPDATNYVLLPGDGITTVFSFDPVQIFATDEIYAVIYSSEDDGKGVLLAQGASATTYSHDVVTFPGTGSVTYPAVGGTPLPIGAFIKIGRVPHFTQTLDLENQGGDDSALFERQVDRLVTYDLYKLDNLERALVGSVFDPLPTTASLFPTPSAGKFLRWNAASLALENDPDHVPSMDNTTAGYIVFDSTTGTPPSDRTFTFPATLAACHVQMTGAGGQGGGGAALPSSGATAGGGGGGGSHTDVWFLPSPTTGLCQLAGLSVTITHEAVQNDNPGADGADASDSTFVVGGQTLILAGGGKGGKTGTHVNVTSGGVSTPQYDGLGGLGGQAGGTITNSTLTPRIDIAGSPGHSGLVWSNVHAVPGEGGRNLTGNGGGEGGAQATTGGALGAISGVDGLPARTVVTLYF